MKKTSFSYQPIGYFHCAEKNPVDAPRQGSLSNNNWGEIHFTLNIPSESLQDLIGFDRLWLIYDFHHNSEWKSWVMPPRGSEKKRGVFATRSPYRPNSIGLSCVRFLGIEKSIVQVEQHDLLDGTPILDIKPYLPYSDAFPGVATGWISHEKPYEVYWSDYADREALWLTTELKIDLKNIVQRQLEFEPTDDQRKRVRAQGEHWLYSYRTWRVLFQIDEGRITILSLKSGYTASELVSDVDPYGDKDLHRRFIKRWS